MLKLVFVFPYRGVGGVSLLFLRVGEYLSENLNCDVYLVDYNDGFMHQNASKSVKLIEYSDVKECTIPSHSIVIFQNFFWRDFKLPSRSR